MCFPEISQICETSVLRVYIICGRSTTFNSPSASFNKSTVIFLFLICFLCMKVFQEEPLLLCLLLSFFCLSLAILSSRRSFLARNIKESIYIRVNNPTLNNNIGKFNLSHIWDRVLLNTEGLNLKKAS